MNQAIRNSDRRYILIWGVLIAALVISLGLGALGHITLAIVAIFAIAIIKALLVLAHFMHLKFEPRWVHLVLLGALMVVAIFYFGLVPDIVWVFGKMGPT